MCATVCPSQALAYVPLEQIRRERREIPTNVFYFGSERVTTKVFMMVPPDSAAISIDVIDYMWETVGLLREVREDSPKSCMAAFESDVVPSVRHTQLTDSK